MRFCDIKLKSYGTTTPTINTYDINKFTKNIVIACDGLWDVIEDDMAHTMIKDINNSNESCKLLMEKSH